MRRPCLSIPLILLLSVVYFAGRCQDVSNAEKQLILKLNIFSGDTEKKYFNEIAATGSTDLFQLLLVAGNANYSLATSNTASEKIAGFIQQHAQDGKQYSGKEIKKLYTEIHDAFFTKYVDNPAFAQIFSNGNYNCATASALYAVLLNKLNVEYDIRELPTHVFIVAAPSTYNVVYETTAPGALVFQLNENVKKTYLEYLQKNKIIGADEVENGDRNALFEKYFYGNNAINLQQLCGLLYYNRGIEAIQKEDYATGYKNFEKAYFLHPSSRMKYFVSTFLGAYLYKATNLSEEEKLTALNRYMQVGDSAAGRDMIGELTMDISKKYLFKYPDMPKYLSLHRSIVGMVKDTAMLALIQHNHYTDMAHYFNIKEEMDSAKLYLDSLYRTNTNDLIVKELLTNTLFNMVRKLPEGKESADAIRGYVKTYPFLSANSALQDYYVICLVMEIGDKYNSEKETAGRPYLDELKATLNSQPALAKRAERYIEAVIPEVCGYYARKKNYKTVKENLLFFKKLLPDNEEINRRLKNVEIRLNEK